MNKLRVGLSSTMLEPVLTHGRLDGIGVYTRALMRGLPANACEVQPWSYVLTPNQTLASQFEIGQAMPDSFIWASVRDLLTPKQVKTPMSADIFHVTDYRVARMECPVVATLHDAIPIKFPHWCNGRARGLKNWLQKKAAKKADHVIALSNYAVAELVEYFGVDEQRITVVPCGVDEGWQQKPDPTLVQATLQKYSLRAGYFLFVGTLQPRKNVERIVDAYLALPADVRRARQLVIVGRVGWHCEELMRKFAAAKENAEQIVWLNGISSDQELRHLYDGAGIFVFPSLYEGFGIPVAEAFAAGVPVITSNTTSLPEVSQGAALEIDPLNVAEISDAMRLLSQDEALRTRCVQAGYARVAELSWAKTAEMTAAVYRAVLRA